MGSEGQRPPAEPTPDNTSMSSEVFGAELTCKRHLSICAPDGPRGSAKCHVPRAPDGKSRFIHSGTKNESFGNTIRTATGKAFGRNGTLYLFRFLRGRLCARVRGPLSIPSFYFFFNYAIA